MEPGSTNLPFNLLKILLPNLLIFYAFSTDGFRPLWSYQETFGNEEYYLDLYYRTNPNGPLHRDVDSDSVQFSGFLVTQDHEEQVQGFRHRINGKLYYHFITEKGKFIAQMRPPRGKSCEPLLDFRVGESSTDLKTGTLRASFCPKAG